MKINYEVAPEFRHLEGWLRDLASVFPQSGTTIFKSRNEVKIFNVGTLRLNVKEFKIPNQINRFVYVYLRGSKAERSYRYARKLQALDVSTPVAVGFLDCQQNGMLKKSYYVSNHFEYEFTLRDVLNYKVPDREAILTQWVRFTYDKLHRNNIFHLDYSPGNTLIGRRGDQYDFQIVDLNRMRFCTIGFEKGLYNFRQLDTDTPTLELIAATYALLCGRDRATAIELLTGYDRKNKADRHIRGKLKQRIRSFFRSGRGA